MYISLNAFQKFPSKHNFLFLVEKPLGSFKSGKPSEKVLRGYMASASGYMRRRQKYLHLQLK